MSTKQIASPLSRKATLVSVNISQWTARKLDRKVTDEVNKQHNASQDAGRYNKLLIETKHLADLTKIVSNARSAHHKYTKPWADEGPRILPNTLFSKFANEFRDLKRQFDAAADAFCKGYPDFVAERKRALNGMFNEDDYPSVNDIRSKFVLKYDVMPFPEASDWRADLDPEIVEEIRGEIADSTTSAVDRAMLDTKQQIVEVVGHMAKKLGDFGVKQDGAKKANWFADSLVGNVRELADLLDAFNLTDDADLKKVTAKIRRDLCKTEPQVLRDDANERAIVKKSAEAILADVSKFMA